MADRVSRVEIGYLEKNENQTLESRFFPSKVGGKPAWLDLKNISIDISCGVCHNQCAFLCQLYAPIAEERGYHRSIYIFICRNPQCCIPNKADNFKVFRCQLPKVNCYYVPEEPNDSPDWHPESTIERFNQICVVCGCLGSYRCAKCRTVNYCSKEHQKLDWGFGHKENCCTDSKRTTHPEFLFPEFEVFTEPEEVEDESGTKTEKSNEETLKEYEDMLKEGKCGTLQEIPSEMMEELALGKGDKYLEKFKSRLKSCPDQVVRYERGGEPLWITKPNITEEEIPCCEICVSPREFEFQVLPTLLSYLNVDALDKSIDWGTLLVFTCKNSCDEGPAYKKEFLWKQDVL